MTAEHNDHQEEGEGDYAVGYGRPPLHTRFPPGRSGNPNGKERGQKSLKTVVSKVLNQKVSVRTPRGTRKMTKLEALVNTITNDALNGDRRARDQIVRLAKDVGLDELAQALGATVQHLTEEDERILARYGSRATSEGEDAG